MIGKKFYNMIRQEFNILNYWKVIVYYDIDYNFFDYIAKDLAVLGSPVEGINYIKHELLYNAKAVTYSNIQGHISLIAFNKHTNKYDYINSIVHEAEHVKQHIFKAYTIKDEGENAAYTIGCIVSQMLRVKPTKMLVIEKM